MRVVFMGTPQFAVPILERTAQAHTVVAVYSRPDAASGRGSRLVAPPVKIAAADLGLPVRQPATLRSPEAAASLLGDAPDVIVVAAYGLILPQAVLDVPALGCVNVHASLLPRHRGAAPVQRAILEGDAETGVSIMRMEAGLDTGPFALQRAVKVDDLDTGELTERLAAVGAEALIDVLDEIEAGTVVWTPQDDTLATYAAKVTRDDVALDSSLCVIAALRRVRASSRQARCAISVDGVDVVLVHAAPTAESVPPGIARRSSGGLLLGFSDGAVLVDALRPAGRAALDGASWARGSRMTSDVPWVRA